MADKDPDREAECARQLFELRWGEEFSCRRCEHRTASQLKSRPRVWSCNKCRTHHSVTAGTVLHRSKVPLDKVFRAIAALMSHGSISARRLARQLGLRIDTAWKLAQRLRAALAARSPKLVGKITVSDTAVAIRRYFDSARRGGALRSKLYPVVLVAVDERWRTVAVASTDRWFRPIDLLREHTKADDFTFAPDHVVPKWIGTILHKVHRTVTSRWLPRYLAALAALQTFHAEARDPTEATLAAVVASHGSAFAGLRPPKNTWDASWKQRYPRMNHLLLERVRMPLRRGARYVLRRGSIQVPGTPAEPGAADDVTDREPPRPT